MKAHTEASVDSMSLVPERLVSRLQLLDSSVSIIVIPFGLNGVRHFHFTHSRNRQENKGKQIEE